MCVLPASLFLLPYTLHVTQKTILLWHLYTFGIFAIAVRLFHFSSSSSFNNINNALTFNFDVANVYKMCASEKQKKNNEHQKFFYIMHNLGVISNSGWLLFSLPFITFYCFSALVLMFLSSFANCTWIYVYFATHGFMKTITSDGSVRVR